MPGRFFRRRFQANFLNRLRRPFHGRSIQELSAVTREEALRHPAWQMGGKITVDSATLMNKGLEVIETSWLFDCPAERIEVVIHPQSIIHSMVEMQDGSVLAQMGFPDMKLPIQLALTWPKRLPSAQPAFDPFDPRASRLTFEPPDRETFRLLDLAYAACNRGAQCLLCSMQPTKRPLPFSLTVRSASWT